MFYIRLTLGLHNAETVEFFGHSQVSSDRFGHCAGNGAENIEVAAWSTLPFVAVVRGGDDEPYVNAINAEPLPHTAEHIKEDQEVCA